ncbi:PQQ-binding-like beta-propeller repeat protein [Kitasatospora sp. MBT63]|uniref:outer membrane protein assembly factor BamB family protein n=1 Tax=Kitasatospora sp. MBT63 TaxID=1444768 RepID=UPI0009E68146|nr:PQQ-binding-like beta-propeller repeat protein [Kitasatospora sp. MBT63]
MARNGARAYGAPAVWGGGVLCGSGLDVWLVDPRTGAELARGRLPGAAAHGAVADAELQPVFTALDPDRCVVRCDPRALVLLRRSAGTAGSWFSHDADLAARAPELCGAVLWLRERRAGWVAVDPADGRRLWTVAGGRASAWGVAEVGGGFVVADEGGSLLRLDADGRVLGRQPVGRRISALHGLGGGRVAVSGKGTLKGLALGWATGAAGLSTRVDTSGSST